MVSMTVVSPDYVSPALPPWSLSAPYEASILVPDVEDR